MRNKSQILSKLRADGHITDEEYKALKQELILDKPHIKGNYYDGFKNGLRTAEWRNDKIRAEIEQTVEHEIKEDEKWALGLKYSLQIIDKYRKGTNE